MTQSPNMEELAVTNFNRRCGPATTGSETPLNCERYEGHSGRHAAHLAEDRLLEGEPEPFFEFVPAPFQAQLVDGHLIVSEVHRPEYSSDTGLRLYWRADQVQGYVKDQP